MQLTEKNRTEFDQQGYTVLDDVFTQEQMLAAEEALNELHRETPKFIASLRDPRLLFLLHDPKLEQIARHVLGADEVVHTSNTSLFKAPDAPDATWKMNLNGEHVDTMFSLEELNAQPKKMTVILMIHINDTPEGRANTFIRPGTHRMVAQHLADEGKQPFRATPTLLKNLPQLNWPEPQAIVGKRGQVVATTTALAHSGSNNVTDQPRQLIFSNFCPRGMLRQVSGNQDRWAEREAYRAELRELFPPERRHLLDETFLGAQTV